MLKFNIDETEIITLPQMRAAFFKDFSHEPEAATMEMAKKWLAKHGLEMNKDGIKNFGFDCDEFPTNRPDGKHWGDKSPYTARRLRAVLKGRYGN